MQDIPLLLDVQGYAVTDCSKSRINVHHEIVIKQNTAQLHQKHCFVHGELRRANSIDNCFFRHLIDVSYFPEVAKLKFPSRVRLADVEKIGLFIRKALQDGGVMPRIEVLPLFRFVAFHFSQRHVYIAGGENGGPDVFGELDQPPRKDVLLEFVIWSAAGVSDRSCDASVSIRET